MSNCSLSALNVDDDVEILHLLEAQLKEMNYSNHISTKWTLCHKKVPTFWRSNRVDEGG